MSNKFNEILNKINREAFDTIDPSVRNYGGGMNNYQKRGFDSQAQQAPAMATKAVAVSNTSPVVQFSVTITNTMLADLKIELFQFSSSQTKMTQTDVNNYVPANAMQNTLTFATGAANTYVYGSASANLTQFVNNATNVPNVATPNVVGFNAAGDLIYQPGLGAAGAVVAGNVTVSCQQVPYAQLFNNSGTYPFRVVKIRMTFNSDAQVSQEIVEREKTFLGSTYQDKVSPDTYRTPNQFQNLIIDVPTPFVITNERGLNYTILGTTNAGVAANTVKMNMFLQVFTKGQIPQ